MKVYIIIRIIKAIWVVLVVHQSILQIIETHFAYEDGDSDYGYMDATHFDIIIFFAKPNGSINHLIGYESVKKKPHISYWYLRLYEERMLTLAPMVRICIGRSMKGQGEPWLPHHFFLILFSMYLKNNFYKLLFYLY